MTLGDSMFYLLEADNSMAAQSAYIAKMEILTVALTWSAASNRSRSRRETYLNPKPSALQRPLMGVSQIWGTLQGVLRGLYRFIGFRVSQN